MCNGKISVALAGPIPLGRAYNMCGTRPFLVAKAKSGKPIYHSVLVTNDPGVRELRDLKGRKVGLFKGSTAAHILPVKILKNAGVPLSDIQPVFLEGQDRIVAALLSGELAAAGMKETLFRKIAKEHLRVLATSEDIPNFALTALPSFPEKVRKQLVHALLSVQPLVDKKDVAIVKGWDDEVKNGFVEPDSNYLPAILNLYSIYWEVTNEP
jgi:sulfonate transport system substrate-binding protein